MADLTIELKLYIDPTDTTISTIAPQAIFTIGSNKFACASDKINLSLSNGFVEASVEGRNIYKWTEGDTFGGNTMTASLMFDNIRTAIASA